MITLDKQRASIENDWGHWGLSASPAFFVLRNPNTHAIVATQTGKAETMTSKTQWTDEQSMSALLLRDKGYPAQYTADWMAKEFGRSFTKNMVLGHLWRIDQEMRNKA